MRRTLPALALGFLLPAGLLAQEAAAGAAAHSDADATRGSDLEWAAITPEGFEPGMQIAVVSGDPTAEGHYVIRLSFPDGYRFPAHWHPNDENLTVLTGTFLLAMGEEEDEASLRRYHPGDFIFAPARMSHYGGASQYTVIQLHGTGPFEVYLTGQGPE